MSGRYAGNEMLISGAIIERHSSNQTSTIRATANIPDNIHSCRRYRRSSSAGENPLPQTNNNRTTGRSGIGSRAPVTIDTMASSGMCYSTILDRTRLSRLGIACRAPLTSKDFCREMSRTANITRQNQLGVFKLKTGLDRALKLTGPDLPVTC
jgi:hypothetical protein